MKLTWTCNRPSLPAGAAFGQYVYFSEHEEDSDDMIHKAIILCVEKAISLLEENVKDESRYFLFE